VFHRTRHAVTLALLAVAPHLAVAQASGERAPERAGERAKQPLQDLLQADAVYPQERGETQLTLVPRFTHWGHERLLQSSFIVEYGLSSTLQIEAEGTAFSYRPAAPAPLGPGLSSQGASELGIGLRQSWMDVRGTPLHIAAGLGILRSVRAPLATGDARSLAVVPSFVIARDLPRLGGMQLFANAEVEVPLHATTAGDDAGEADDAALEWHTGFFVPAGAVVITAELSTLADDRPAVERTRRYATLGLVTTLPGGWELGIGAPYQIRGPRGRFDTLVKVTYEF
jgi:hypothetical protein